MVSRVRRIKRRVVSWQTLVSEGRSIVRRVKFRNMIVGFLADVSR